MLAAAGPSPAERLDECLACHGAGGQSETAGVPSLGGLASPYLVIQLFLFREGMRVAAPMNDLMKGVSDEDLQAMADLIAKLPPPKPPADPGDAKRMAAGRTLAAAQHCNVCHQPAFTGLENVPRLADQREDYLLETLRAYKSGTRHGYDTSMAEVVEPLGDGDFVPLAYYLAHVR
jgi:cytochrome c553